MLIITFKCTNNPTVISYNLIIIETCVSCKVYFDDSASLSQDSGIKEW